MDTIQRSKFLLTHRSKTDDYPHIPVTSKWMVCVFKNIQNKTYSCIFALFFNIFRRFMAVFIIYLGFLMSLSTHCIGHITTGSFMCRGNQQIKLVKVLYCKLPTNGKQLPAFPLEIGQGFELRSQKLEVSVTTLTLWPLFMAVAILLTVLLSLLFISLF